MDITQTQWDTDSLLTKYRPPSAYTDPQYTLTRNATTSVLPKRSSITITTNPLHPRHLPPPSTNTKYSTQARLYLSKYHALHTLSRTLLTTASTTLDKYLHNGCLCFIHPDLLTCHSLIAQLDALSAETHAHAHEIGARSFIESERLERLRRRDDKLLERRNEMSWELIARQCQLDAQVRRWNGIIRRALRTRELDTAARVGLMMCHSRLGLAHQAVRKQERRNWRMQGRLVSSWEKVDRARRLAGFLAEYDECLQGLQGCVDFVARGVEGRMRGMVERGGGVEEEVGGA